MKAIELVTYLNEREAASIDELTSEFEVSARTVRLHIQRTNEMLEGLATSPTRANRVAMCSL